MAQVAKMNYLLGLRSFALMTRMLVLVSPYVAPAQSSEAAPGKIDISKLNPTELLVDNYSYMAQPYNFYYYHHMDDLGFRADWVHKPEKIYPLSEPSSAFPLKYEFHQNAYSLDDYLKRNDVTALLVLHEDQIVYEKYLHGANQNSRFVSQSISKSIVSILVGAAVTGGKIKSVDDPVGKYLPYLASSGYRGVTIRSILEMATGVDYSPTPGPR
jgi:hypothetical protein